MKKNILLSFGLLIIGNIVLAEGENSSTVSKKEGIAEGLQAMSNLGYEYACKPFQEYVLNPVSDSCKAIWMQMPALAETLKEESKDSKKSGDNNTSDKNVIIKTWNNLSSTQKYIMGAVVLSTIAAGIAYQLGYFSKTSDLNVTENDIQKMVESVVFNDLISQQDKLNQVFEILTRNGLGNIVVYSDTMFDVEDTFRVEISGEKVYVIRCK